MSASWLNITLIILFYVMLAACLTIYTLMLITLTIRKNK